MRGNSQIHFQMVDGRIQYCLPANYKRSHLNFRGYERKLTANSPVKARINAVGVRFFKIKHWTSGFLCCIWGKCHSTKSLREFRMRIVGVMEPLGEKTVFLNNENRARIIIFPNEFYSTTIIHTLPHSFVSPVFRGEMGTKYSNSVAKVNSTWFQIRSSPDDRILSYFERHYTVFHSLQRTIDLQHTR